MEDIVSGKKTDERIIHEQRKLIKTKHVNFPHLKNAGRPDAGEYSLSKYLQKNSNTERVFASERNAFRACATTSSGINCSRLAATADE